MSIYKGLNLSNQIKGYIKKMMKTFPKNMNLISIVYNIGF